MANQMKIKPKQFALAILRGNPFAELAFCDLYDPELLIERRLGIIKRAAKTSDYVRLTDEIIKCQDLEEMGIFILGFKTAAIKRKESFDRQIVASESAAGTSWLVGEKAVTTAHIVELCRQIIEKLDSARKMCFEPYRGTCTDQSGKERIDALETKINKVIQRMNEK